jgi:hypothetical protein
VGALAARAGAPAHGGGPVGGAFLIRLAPLVLLAGCYDVGSLSARYAGDAGDLAAADLALADLAGADLASVDLAGADLAHPTVDLGPAPDLSGSRTMFVLLPDRYGDVLAAPGGVTVLDAACTTAANNAGLPGFYLALIADSTISTGRITFSNSRPIVLPSGTPLSSGLLFSTGVSHAINEQADRSPLPATPSCVWTGFTTTGAGTGSDCTNWTVGLGTPNYLGTTGDTRGTTWTAAIDLVCNVATCFIYCIEQ